MSDTAPVVAPNRAHQSETLWTGEIGGALGAQSRRPNPRAHQLFHGRECDDYWRVRAYLGADDHDSHWGVTMLLKAPTPREWERGDRTFRCDAAAPARGTGTPSMVGTLRGDPPPARLGPVPVVPGQRQEVTCDQLHDREAMSPDVQPRGATWTGPDSVRAMAQAACVPVAEA